MFLLRVLIIYAVLFCSLAIVYQKTDFRNPALMFFVPSICAMLFVAKVKLAEPSAHAAALAIKCGLCFALMTLASLLLFEQCGGVLKRAGLMYAMAFGGNFFFPILMFPSIQKVQR